MQERVKVPAIALIVVGILGVVMAIFGLVASPSNMADMYAKMGMPEEQLEMLRSGGSSLLNIVGGVMGLAGSGFIIFGALQMMKLRNWAVALIAAILAMIPCFTSCVCLLGLPIGIWAIIVLSNGQVKAAFQQNSTPS